MTIELYQLFVEGECVVTNARTAEMAKLTENASRDVSIAFANELSIVCEKLEINIWELISLANRHPRVNILQPGPGVGGHCIAVDPWFIASSAPEEAVLIRTARQVNDSKPGWVIDRVKSTLLDFLQDNPDKAIGEVTIACYGLAFKPNIDDLRESPAVKIAQEISSFHRGITLCVEPNISSYSGMALVDLCVASKSADIHVLLVAHQEFESHRPESNPNYIIDTNGLWSH